VPVEVGRATTMTKDGDDEDEKEKEWRGEEMFGI
jgi:hypothetical protein